MYDCLCCYCMDQSDFFGIGEESASNGWEALLEGELEATNQHVRAHDPSVCCDQNDAATVLFLFFGNETIFTDDEFATVLISASLFLHKFCVLGLDVAAHFLYISLVILTAHDDELRLDELNHGLQN